jgi:hypothetical protein
VIFFNHDFLAAGFFFFLPLPKKSGFSPVSVISMGFNIIFSLCRDGEKTTVVRAAFAEL